MLAAARGAWIVALLAVDTGQIFALIWQLAQPWPWPWMWMRWTRFFAAFNADGMTLLAWSAASGTAASPWGEYFRPGGFLGYVSCFSLASYALAALLLALPLHLARRGGWRGALGRSAAGGSAAALLWVSLAPLALAQLRLFACEPRSTSAADPALRRWVLAADPAVECLAAPHKRAMALAVPPLLLLLALYPLALLVPARRLRAAFPRRRDLAAWTTSREVADLLLPAPSEQTAVADLQGPGPLLGSPLLSLLTGGPPEPGLNPRMFAAAAGPALWLRHESLSYFFDTAVLKIVLLLDFALVRPRGVTLEQFASGAGRREIAAQATLAWLAVTAWVLRSFVTLSLERPIGGPFRDAAANWAAFFCAAALFMSMTFGLLTGNGAREAELVADRQAKWLIGVNSLAFLGFLVCATIVMWRAARDWRAAMRELRRVRAMAPGWRASHISIWRRLRLLLADAPIQPESAEAHANDGDAASLAVAGSAADLFRAPLPCTAPALRAWQLVLEAHGAERCREWVVALQEARQAVAEARLASELAHPQLIELAASRGASQRLQVQSAFASREELERLLANSAMDAERCDEAELQEAVEASLEGARLAAARLRIALRNLLGPWRVARRSGSVFALLLSEAMEDIVRAGAQLGACTAAAPTPTARGPLSSPGHTPSL